jgi:hypothetical protein
VARAYYDVIQHLKRNASECFQHLGVRRDPQARDHDIYAYSGETLAASARVVDLSIRQAATGADITPQAIEAAERILALHIGPMAKILVRKTVPRAGSRAELYQLLADLIPDPAPRGAFLTSVVASSGPVSSMSQVRTGSVSASASSAAGSASALGCVISDEELARIEKLFARYIGPMAKVLVRRESRTANSLETLCRALASHIDKDSERQRFMGEAGF